MPVTFTKTTSINADGRSFNEKKTVEGGEATVVSLTLPAAKAGTMTTKSSASVGLITTTAAHGLSPGDKVSVFWVDTAGDYKCRHNCTLSAASGSTMTTTTATGLGDDLPVDGTVLTVGLVVSRTIIIQGTANGLKGIAVGAGVRAGAMIQEDVTADSGDILLQFHQDNGFGFGWVDGEAFPVALLTGDFDAVAGANGDSSREVTMNFCFLDA